MIVSCYKLLTSYKILISLKQFYIKFTHVKISERSQFIRWPGNWLGKKWCTVNHFSYANHKSYLFANHEKLRGWWVRNRRKNFLHCKPATCVCYSLPELKSLIAKQSITHVVYYEIKSSRINWKFVKLTVFIIKVGLLLILKLLLV